MATKKTAITRGAAMLIVKISDKPGNGDMYRVLMVLQDGGPAGKHSTGQMLAKHFTWKTHVQSHVNMVQRHFRIFGIDRKIHLPEAPNNKHNIVLSDDLMTACEAATQNTGTKPAHVYYTDLTKVVPKQPGHSTKGPAHIVWYYIDYDGTAAYDLLPGAMTELSLVRASILTRSPGLEHASEDDEDDDPSPARSPKVARPKSARPAPVYDRLIATLVGLSFRERPETMTIAEGRAGQDVIVAEAGEFVKSQLPVFGYIDRDKRYIGEYFLHRLKAHLRADNQYDFCEYADANPDLWEDFVFHVRFSEPRLPKLGDLDIPAKAIQGQTLELHIGELFDENADVDDNDF